MKYAVFHLGLDCVELNPQMVTSICEMCTFHIFATDGRTFHCLRLITLRCALTTVSVGILQFVHLKKSVHEEIPPHLINRYNFIGKFFHPSQFWPTNFTVYPVVVIVVVIIIIIIIILFYFNVVSTRAHGGLWSYICLTWAAVIMKLCQMISVYLKVITCHAEIMIAI